MSDATTYRPDIDGLRAIAVMAVVLHHLSARFVPGGYVGVDVFFVISGYLITKIIHGEIAAGTFTFASFYERRVRRIFPALIAVLAAVMLLGWFVYLPSDYLATLRAAVGTILFAANIVFWRDLKEGYFANDAKDNPLLHMWSLGVEEQFYIIFPIFLILCMRYARGLLVPILVACAAASLALAAALVGAKSVAVFFLTPFRVWELMAGCIVAIAALPQPASLRMRQSLALVAMLAIVVPVFAYTTETTFPGIAAVPVVIGTALMIHLGAEGRTVVSTLLSWRPAVFMGLISYSLYLWHWPMIVFAKYLLGTSSLRYWIPLVLAASVAAAWLSYQFIEKPARRAGGRTAKRHVLVLGSVAVIVFSLIGAIGIRDRGFEVRWPTASNLVDRARTAPVPFKSCEARVGAVSDELCIIGDASVQPDALLWGDSHLLAWLPGFDVAYRSAGRSALVAPNSMCPPLLGVENARDAPCRRQNDAVLAKLESSPEIRQVVLAGFWRIYFADSNYALSTALGPRDNAAVSSVALESTLSVIASGGRDIVVLGPVPNYRVDVPSSVARSLSGEANAFPVETLESIRRSNAHFYEVVESSIKPGFRFVDVAQWMCQDECLVYDTQILYRDSNHLSPYGAIKYVPQLEGVIKITSRVQSSPSDSAIGDP